MSTSAGWYDDGSGRHRWWDGDQWTDHFADEQTSHPRASEILSNATSAIVSNFAAKNDPANEPGTLWSAIGRPVTGLGAGRYRLTDEYLIFEKGTLSTKSQQIRVHEIFDVDAAQTLTQKARGVGTITLWAQRPSGRERVLLDDIPNFREGVSIINRVADEARQRLITRQNTQHYNYTGTPSGAPPSSFQQFNAAPTAPSTGGLNEQLIRMAELHQQGILDDEEFAAAKRKLLGL